MFTFGPNPTRAKKAWSSSTCLLYVQEDIMETTFLVSFLGNQDYYSCGGTLIASQESSFTKFLPFLVCTCLKKYLALLSK
jgi:hypothetical protein